MTTLFWCLEYGKVLFAYLIIMFVWPQIMFRNYLRGKSLTFQFGFCTTVQIILVNTVVLGLGLLHILKPWIFCLLFYGSALFMLGRKIQWKEKVMKTIHRLLGRTYGSKLFLSDCTRSLRRKCKNGRHIVRAKLKGHVFEAILLAVVVLFGVMYFSYGSLQDYSYGFGDLYPHNAWIYGLCKGQIFSSGVYPEGMHCFEYALHTLFHIRIYSCLMFTGCIHMGVFLISVYIFLKEVFRVKYSAIASLALFLTVDVVTYNEVHSMARMQLTLPQEFGFYAMFLCVAFFLRYMKNVDHLSIRQNNQSYTRWQKRILADKLNYNEDLLIFMLALAVTVIVHFYATIIAFFLCAAFVPMLLFKVLKPRNFGALIMAVIVGCAIAVLPMAGALASGIPFQGSIGWAVNVINGTDNQGEGAIIIDETTGEQITGNISFSGNHSQDKNQNTEGNINEGANGSSTAPVEKVALVTRLKNAVIRFVDIIYHNSYVALYRETRAKLIAAFTVLAFAIFVFGRMILTVLGMIKKQKQYRNACDYYFGLALSTIIFMFLYDTRIFGLPSLIAGSRLCSTGQLLILSMCCIPFDVVCALLAHVVNEAVIKSIALVSVAAIYITTRLTGTFHGYLYIELTRYNSVVMSTYAITRDLPKFSYTIVSPVDELYQINQYGYHEELVLFINNCVKQNYTLPTEYVFIFVEKKPLFYAQSHFFEGPSWLAEEKYAEGWPTHVSQCPDIIHTEISEDYANSPYYVFPLSSRSYSQLSSRVIVESRAYKWCQQFDKLYPGELHTYYEDDDFVCYYFKQNPACLYQLGFDLE